METMRIKKLIKIVSIILIISLVSVFAAACRGASAYEIAVRNGFSGTESEWVDSLKGSDGKNYQGTAYDLYTEAVSHGGFDGTFTEFIARYLVGSPIYETDVIAGTLFSAVSIRMSIPKNSYSSSASLYMGSGVVYSIDKTLGNAYIITNEHVVYPAVAAGGTSKIYACFYGNEYQDGVMECEYVGGSVLYDIALLKVTGSNVVKNSNAVAASFGDSEELCPGQTVYAVGNDDGDGISVTKGIISVDSEEITLKSDKLGTTFKIREIRHDAATALGISGGGIYDSDGKLIAIANAKTVEEETEGMSYGIPGTVAKRVIDKILHYCDGKTATAIKKPMLGITISANESKGVYNAEKGRAEIVEEVVITEVSSSASNAVKAALRVGDRVLSVSCGEEERTVTRVFQIPDFVLSLYPGDVVTFKVVRDGAERTVNITIVETMMKTVD